MSQEPTPSADERIAALEAENARLRQEAARCQGLFAAMDEAFVLLDVVYDDAGHAVDARVVDANDAFAAMVGRSTAETAGLTLRDLLPAIAPWWIDTAGQVALTGAPVRFSAHGDVTARDYEVGAWCPGPGQCAALLHDVTEQKRVEEALRASERPLARNLDAMTRLQTLSTRLVPTDELMPLLHEILAAAADLTGTDKGNIQFLDPNTGKLRIVAQQGLSPQYCAYFAEDGCEGTCKAALAARRRVVIADLSEEPRLQGTEDMAVCRAEGLRAVISTPLMARDGRPLGMISNHYTAPHQPDEHELHVLDLLARMAADVIERSRAEEALRESEARFRDVLENSRDMVYRRNLRTRRYDYVSPSAERVLGYTADEILAMTVDEVVAHVHPDDVAEFHARDAALAASRAERPSNTSEYRWRAKGGEYVWLSASRALIRDAEGRPLAHVGTVRNITGAKRAQHEREELLHRAEAERATLEAVLEQMPSGVMIAEAPSGRVTLANRRMHEIGGWTALPESAFDERRHWQGHHPDGRPYAAEEWPLARAILHGQVVRDQEIAVVRADGTSGVISASGAPVRDTEGRIIAGVVIDLDITERKQAAAAIESLSRFPSENPAPVLRVARDGALLFANAASAPILSLWNCPSGGRVPEAWQRLIAAALDAGTGRAIDVAAGAVTYALYVAPIADAGYANIYGTDVTAEREAMAALRESEARFRELADAMPQLVWTARPDGTVDYYNRRYVEFGGIAPTADRWEWAPVLHPDDVERTAQVWHRALETGAVYEAEHRARRADGGYRWHLSRALPVRDAQGRIIRWYGTATDIHDTKMAQEALRESERRLRDLNETLEDRVAERTAQLRTLAAELAFAEERERQRLADLLHDDLQQTLAAAVYHLDLVREQVSSEECRTSLEGPMTMLREAIHTSRTLSAELSPTLLRDTRLGAMLQNLAQLVEEQHGLRVAVDDREPADAPPPPDDVRLLLYRCIRELLYNAKKHAGVAGASLLVHRPTPHFIEVTVADEGHGFDPEVVHRRGPRPGGLGLFSIEERLAYIGGEVRIDSAPGRGTRIMLHVPLSHAALDAGTPGTSGVAQPAATTAAEDSLETGDGERRLRVLLADDHAVVRSALGSLLEGQPDMVVVGEAGDGVEAVELARALRPDVVLMDVGMPQMDGIEATRRLKAELPGIRVIGLSMYGGEKEGLMRQAGAEAYVPKGGPPAALLAAIRDTGKEA